MVKVFELKIDKDSLNISHFVYINSIIVSFILIRLKICEAIIEKNFLPISKFFSPNISPNLEKKKLIS